MLDKLKAFFNGEINVPALQKVVDLKNIALQFVQMGDGNAFVKIDKSQNHTFNVTVNVDSKEVKDPEVIARQVGELLQQHVQAEKKPVLEIDASKVVEEISSATKYNDCVQYFKGKIPEKDLLTLRAAYFIRQESEEGKPVSRLVKGVSSNYGSRGNSIVNLCGRGYFEDYIKPLYETLSLNPNFEKKMFLDRYVLIIDNAPFAYYVNRNQTEQDLVENLLEKIPFSKQYGQKKLAIHAIGKDNVDNAQKAVNDQRIADLINPEDTEIDLKKNVMTLTVYFKSEKDK